jgi:hypothetical protein
MISYLPLRGICALWLMLSLSAWAAPPAIDVDNELSRAIANNYSRLAKSAINPSDLKNVLAQANAAFKAQDYAGTLQILATNKALDRAHLDDPNMQAIVRLVLQSFPYLRTTRSLSYSLKRIWMKPMYYSELRFKSKRNIANPCVFTKNLPKNPTTFVWLN